MSFGGNTTTVYGGDEISAIILDPGSYNTRIGYAGDDFPKITTSSFYGQVGNGKRIFGEDINVPRENCEIKPILKDSIITDWDAAIDQYKYYFKDTLKVDYKDQPVLITEPIWTELPYRQKLIETFYETFDFAGLYLAKAPTCISFQQGRPNCLVVDLGHDTVSVTPVIDGICLIKNSMRTNYGGRFLNDEIKDFVKSRDPKITVEPTYKIKTKTPTVYPDPAEYTVKKTIPTTTESFNKFQQQRIWHEFKETALEVPERKLNSTNPQQALSIKEFYSQDSQKRLFEFPTGQSITLGLERFQFAESIFDPKIYKFSDENIAKAYPPSNGEIKISSHYNEYRPLKRIRKPESNQSTPAPGEGDDSSEKIRGLSHLITHTLSTIDIDLRASIAHNIIVTGGVSLIPQLIERLYNELSNSNPGLKIRLHAVGNSSERVNQAWIGGSVLASLGTFHQMWVTKHEYNEAGADRILNQRFR